MYKKIIIKKKVIVFYPFPESAIPYLRIFLSRFLSPNKGCGINAPITFCTRSSRARLVEGERS